MVCESADRCADRDNSAAPDGWRRVFMGRHSQIRLCQSRRRTLHQTRYAFSRTDGKLCRRAGNRRWSSFNRRISVQIYRLHIYYRDDCGDFINQNFFISGNFSAALAVLSTANRILGGSARDTFGICTTFNLRLSINRRFGKIGIRYAVGWRKEKRK